MPDTVSRHRTTHSNWLRHVVQSEDKSPSPFFLPEHASDVSYAFAWAPD